MLRAGAGQIVSAVILMWAALPDGILSADPAAVMPAVCDDPDTWHRMTPELSYPPQSTSMVLSDAQLPMVCYKPTYWQGCSLLFAEYDGTEWSESEVDCQQYSGSGSRLFGSSTP